MTKRERPSEWEAELYADITTIAREFPEGDTTVTQENETPVPDSPTVTTPATNEKLGEGLFWELLAQVGYQKW